MKVLLLFFKNFSFKNSEFFLRIITGIVLLNLLVFALFFLPAMFFSVLFIFILITVLLFEWPKFGISWLGPIYPGLPFLFLVLLNHSADRFFLISILFIAVFSHDSGAYILGKLFGNCKLCPSLSPKKTWEGVFGGLFFSCLNVYIFMFFAQLDYSTSGIFLFCLILGFIATLGDLFESYLKRRVGLKDSGYFLPGHGGFLDRFDSILAVAPVLYLFRHELIEILRRGFF